MHSLGATQDVLIINGSYIFKKAVNDCILLLTLFARLDITLKAYQNMMKSFSNNNDGIFLTHWENKDVNKPASQESRHRL